MVRKTKYDLDRFRELVVSGSGKTEIMNEMGIGNASTFNNLILKLMDEDKKYYQVKEPRKVRQKKPATVKIGKNNTLSLSSKLLSGSVFKPGDTFTVKIFKNRINLTLVDK